VDGAFLSSCFIKAKVKTQTVQFLPVILSLSTRAILVRLEGEKRKQMKEKARETETEENRMKQEIEDERRCEEQKERGGREKD
jgi:hypothetical protein